MITLLISTLTVYGMFIIARSVVNHIYQTVQSGMNVRRKQQLKKDLTEMINLTIIVSKTK